MSYSFRIRINSSPRQRLDIDETSIVLPWRDGPSPSDLQLLAGRLDDESIRDAETLVLKCAGFDTAGDAHAAAATCRSMFMAVLAAVNVGADFGDRAAGGFLTDEGKVWVEEERGIERAENDIHGTLVFATEPPPTFVTQSVKAVIQVGREKFERAMSQAIETQRRLAENEQLAYDLYSASFFTENEDARLVSLMMAIETLMDPEGESLSVVNLVSELIDLVSVRTDIAEADSASLKARLGSLKQQSIGQAGRALVSKLEPRKYMDMRPATFFVRCYDIRSRLVHGADPRPSRSDVGHHAASLELLVADLLAGPLAPDRSESVE